MYFYAVDSFGFLLVFFFKFCQMIVFLKYVSPIFKIITNMHFLYICLYFDYKKTYFLTCCIVLISFCCC